MLSRIQGALVVILSILMLAWAIAAAVRGATGHMFDAAIAIALLYSLVIGLEFALLAATARAGGQALRASQLFSAWLTELRTTPAIFMWQQPFAAARWPDQLPDQLPAGLPARRAVLLVHGYFCNRGLWNPWLRRLTEQGTPFIALSLEPVFGSISAYDEQIESAVSRIEACTGMAPVIIAHSMGGLAVRHWWMKHSGERQGTRVHRLLTLGSPHQGTWMAKLGFGRNTAQMRPDSTWLQELGRAEPAGHRHRTVCFFSHYDNIVFPTVAATLRDADNCLLGAVGHVAMVNDPAPFAELQRLLAQPSDADALLHASDFPKR